MKKLLVTGASGFLGSRICEYYKEQYELCMPSHSEMDITDEKAVISFFQRELPDLVIHCAAVSDTGKCEKEPESSWKMNVDGARHVAKAAKMVAAKCLICSSDQVYFGSDRLEAHKEEELLSPENVYGREKLQAEKECLEVNSDSVLLRLAWMYDTKSRGEKEHGDFMRTLLEKLARQETLYYPIYDRRGITDVKEVVQNMQSAFELPGGIYNFGSPNVYHTYETVKRVFCESNLELELLKKNETAFCSRPRNLTMAQDKLNRYGIYFTSTCEGIVRNLKEIRKFI